MSSKRVACMVFAGLLLLTTISAAAVAESQQGKGKEASCVASSLLQKASSTARVALQDDDENVEEASLIQLDSSVRTDEHLGEVHAEEIQASGGDAVQDRRDLASAEIEVAQGEQKSKSSSNADGILDLLLANKGLVCGLFILIVGTASYALKRKRHTAIMKEGAKKELGESLDFTALAGCNNVGLLRRERMVIRNSGDIKRPGNPGLLDNCLLVLPRRAVEHLRLTPNIGDKGMPKTLWLGRVWQLRSLLTAYYETVRKSNAPTSAQRAAMTQLMTDIQKDPVKMKRLKRLQGAWRCALNLRVSSFALLDKIEDRTRGFVLFMHGSGGMTYNNLRFARSIATLDFVVIAPDDCASSSHRHRDLQPLATMDTPMDYWADNLIYSSGASGEYSYSTQVEGVLKDPEGYKVLYEKVYRERASELHYVISKLPKFVDTTGVYIMGTSEGAMTVARFDDQKYGPLINGRIISAFSVEYCYFTPTEQAGLFGGSLDVPTLNLIGSHDQYFGVHDSIAQRIAADPDHGYGNQHLTGNSFKTMLKQGMDRGCVLVFEEGQHDLTITHDNILREVFTTFFSRPNRIHQLHKIWARESHLSQQIEVTDQRMGKVPGAPQGKNLYADSAQKKEMDDWKKNHTFGGLLLLRVKKSPFPQTMLKSKENTLRLIHQNVTEDEIAQHQAHQQNMEDSQKAKAKTMVEGFTQFMKNRKTA